MYIILLKVREKIKQELVIQSDVVKSSINEALVSDKGKEMWKSLFEDPGFVKGFTEAIKDEQTKWMKDLLKDAEYQEQMLELLQNPEISEMILTILKSQQSRANIEEIIHITGMRILTKAIELPSIIFLIPSTK